MHKNDWPHLHIRYTVDAGPSERPCAEPHVGGELEGLHGGDALAAGGRARQARRGRRRRHGLEDKGRLTRCLHAPHDGVPGLYGHLCPLKLVPLVHLPVTVTGCLSSACQ